MQHIFTSLLFRRTKNKLNAISGKSPIRFHVKIIPADLYQKFPIATLRRQSTLEILIFSGLSKGCLNNEIRILFATRRDTKTPAYAVLITFLNLFTKWAPGIDCFRLSAFRPADKRLTCSPQTRIRPQVQNVGSKQMLITRIAGAN